MRLLVCGGRDYTDVGELRRILDKVAAVVRVECVIEGEQRGADVLARMWAYDRAIPFDPYPAEWKRRGKPAGAIRNRQMLRDGKPDLVIAFPSPASKGTWDMVEIARAVGLPVWVMPADEATIDALGEAWFGRPGAVLR